MQPLPLQPFHPPSYLHNPPLAQTPPEPALVLPLRPTYKIPHSPEGLGTGGPFLDVKLNYLSQGWCLSVTTGVHGVSSTATGRCALLRTHLDPNPVCSEVEDVCLNCQIVSTQSHCLYLYHLLHQPSEFRSQYRAASACLHARPIPCPPCDPIGTHRYLRVIKGGSCASASSEEGERSFN